MWNQILYSFIIGWSGYLAPDATGTYSIGLQVQPTDSVVIVAAYETDLVSTTVDTFVFTPDNWATKQASIVTNIADTAVVTGLFYTRIRHRLTSDDARFDGQIVDVSAPLSAGFELYGSDGFGQNTIDEDVLTADPLGDIHFSTEAGLLSLRDSLIAFAWLDGSGLPSTTYDTLETNWTQSTYFDPTTSNISRVDRMAFNINASPQIVNYGYYAISSASSKNKLFVIASGHITNYTGASTDVDIFVSDLLDNGYDVMFMAMPGRNGNIAPSSDHDTYDAYETGSENPIRWFVEGPYRMINYAVDSLGYDDIFFGGISGGGWTTAIYAAIDTRVDKAFSISGVYPTFVSQADSYLAGVGSNTGDWEQMADPTRSSAALISFERNKVSYTDMYLLGAYNREFYQYINNLDACCFFGEYWKLYNNQVQMKLNSFSVSSLFQAGFYTQTNTHAYSQDVVDKILEKIAE